MDTFIETLEVEKVEILLDDRVYQSGDTISGSVNIRLNGELNLMQVSIRLKSVSEVELHEYPITIDGYDGTRVDYNDIEQYLDIEYEIPDYIRNSSIKNGEHVIPFTFKLPNEGIKTSFDGLHGFIKYWIEVNITNNEVIQSSGKSVAFSEKKYLTVESPLLHDLHLSVSGGIEKSVFHNSGKIRINANIRKKGHIPGEKLSVRCRVTNQTSVAVTPFISLTQISIYMAKTWHVAIHGRTEPVIGKRVNAGHTEEQSLSIDIPSDTDLSIKSRLISIKYYIHVTLETPNERDIHLNLPIIVTNKSAFDNIASFM